MRSPEYKRTAFKWNQSGSTPAANWLKAMWNEEDSTNNSTSSLEEQIKDPESMYQFYKDIIEVRKENDALMQGKYISYDCNDAQIMSYKRISDKQSIIVIHNFANNDKVVNLEKMELGKVLFRSNKGNIVIIG